MNLVNDGVSLGCISISFLKISISDHLNLGLWSFYTKDLERRCRISKSFKLHVHHTPRSLMYADLRGVVQIRLVDSSLAGVESVLELTGYAFHDPFFLDRECSPKCISHLSLLHHGPLTLRALAHRFLGIRMDQIALGLVE